MQLEGMGQAVEHYYLVRSTGNTALTGTVYGVLDYLKFSVSNALPLTQYMPSAGWYPMSTSTFGGNLLVFYAAVE